MHKPKELGDMVESALTSVGITKERVAQWLGRPCNCRERRDKLNSLSRWAKRVLWRKSSSGDSSVDGGDNLSVNDENKDVTETPEDHRKYLEELME